MDRRAFALIASITFAFHPTLAAPAAQPAVPASPSAAPSTETPCLGGDPYNLSALRAVISGDVPPSSPVTINAHLVVTYMGTGSWISDTVDSFPPDSISTGNPSPVEPAVADTHFGLTQFRVFNTRTRFMFRVSLSEAMLKAIYGCHEQTARTSAKSSGSDFGAIEGLLRLYLPLLFHGPGPALAQPQLQAPDGWSNHSDTRIIRSPTTVWPWRTISQSSLQPNSSQESLCTMTLIGPRHLITAAHCLVNFGTTAWKARQLTPGRDGVDVKPYGSTQITPNPAPGHESWYFVPDPWLNPGTTNQWEWDWGLVLTQDRIGEQTGWMGYVAQPFSDLEQYSNLNRGYPKCDPSYSERPAGCQAARLYGDTNDCGLGSTYYKGPDDWYRVISLSCDLSRGHSGSAVYHYWYDPHLGQTVPVVAMMVSTQSCTTCTDSDDFPNRARRITPGDLGVISWLRETFP